MFFHKTVLITCLLLSGTLYVFAQTTLKGKLINEKDAVPIANLILYTDAKSKDIIAYTFSNEQGNFELTYKTDKDSILLEITSLGYKKKFLTLSAKLDQFITIQLTVAELQLDEIIIREEQAIVQKKDTINYSVKAFSDQSDRVILDVIKKLPGIKVTETGQILYQNKAISKFYIEGKDLLGDRYNIATNNLPLNAVDKVQVLENHQPIELLNGIAETDRAALNIKLNDSAKVRLLGNGNVGFGASPFLRNNNLTLLKFSKKLQYIASAKNNNVGVNLNDELSEQNFSANLYESGAIKQDVLSLVKASTPTVDRERYWFNNNTLINGNYLSGIGKSLSLRGSIAYVNDVQKDNAASITKIYLPNDTIVINEEQNGKAVYNRLLTDLALEANTEKVYLNNTLRLQRVWSTATDFISSNNISQSLQNPFVNVFNNFNGIININRTLLGLNSFTSYTNVPQKLIITPGQYQDLLNHGQSYDGTVQESKSTMFYTDNSVSLIKGINRFSFGNKLGFLIIHQNLDNNINLILDGNMVNSPKDFNNHILRNKLKLYNESDVSFITDKVNVTFSTKLSENILDNSEKTQKNSAQRFLFNPSLNIRYSINQSFENSINFSRNTILSYTTNQSFILRNYRSLGNSTTPLMEMVNKSVSYRLAYKNIVNAVFSNLEVSYVNGTSNVILTNTFNGILNTISAVSKKNPSQDFNINANVNKSYSSLKTMINVSGGYSISRSLLLQQDSLSDFQSNTLIVGTAISTRPSKLISLEYNIDYVRSKIFNTIQCERIVYKPIYFLTQHVTMKLSFHNEAILKINFENYRNKANENLITRNFADITLQKTVTKYKLDLSVSLNNIFDVSSYSSYNYSTNYFVSSNYNLRPRMLMFTCGFQF